MQTYAASTGGVYDDGGLSEGVLNVLPEGWGAGEGRTARLPYVQAPSIRDKVEEPSRATIDNSMKWFEFDVDNIMAIASASAEKDETPPGIHGAAFTHMPRIGNGSGAFTSGVGGPLAGSPRAADSPSEYTEERPAKRVRRLDVEAILSFGESIVRQSDFSLAQRDTSKRTGTRRADGPHVDRGATQGASAGGESPDDLVMRAETFAAGSPVSEEALSDVSPFFEDRFTEAVVPRRLRMAHGVPTASAVADMLKATCDESMDVMAGAYMITRAVADVDEDMRFHAYAEMHALWNASPTPSSRVLAGRFKGDDAQRAVQTAAHGRVLTCAAPRCSHRTHGTRGHRRLRTTREASESGVDTHVEWVETCDHTRWHPKCLMDAIEACGGRTPCPYCPAGTEAVARTRSAHAAHAKCLVLAETHACDDCRARAHARHD